MLVLVFLIRTTRTEGFITTGGGGGSSSSEEGPTSSMILQSGSERFGIKSSSSVPILDGPEESVVILSVPVISRRMVEESCVAFEWLVEQNCRKMLIY